MDKPTEQQFTGQVIINGKAVNAESLERIQACLAVCEGISTDVLELNATAGGVVTLERQRDALRAALESLVLFTNPAPSNAVALNNAHQVLAQFKGGAALSPLTAAAEEMMRPMKPIPISAAARIAKAYGYDQVIIIARKVGDAPDPHGEHVTTYGTNEGHCEVAARAGDFLKYKVMGWAKEADQSSPPERFTSVSKGGSYERLGAIRGAGALKGLSGIAYRNDKGDLFIREPECFAKRMVLIKPEGGAQ